MKTIDKCVFCKILRILVYVESSSLYFFNLKKIAKMSSKKIYRLQNHLVTCDFYLSGEKYSSGKSPAGLMNLQLAKSQKILSNQTF